MSTRFLTTSVVALLVWAPLEFPVEAQDSSGQQPTPPYLAPIPARLHWIVTFSYSPKNGSGTAPAAPQDNSPVSVETTKVGTTRRIVVKFINGTTQQIDILADHCFYQGPLGLEYRPMGGDFTPYTFFTFGFSFTQCVNLASFKEYTTYQKIPVFHYKDGSTEAWISADTKLPIGADQFGSVSTSYQYLPVPDEVVLTPQEQKMLQGQKRAEGIYNSMR
jgi:hypothetical protein